MKQRKNKMLICKRGRVLLCFIFLFLIFTNISYAQWKKIYDFGKPILVVYFKENASSPNDGFIGITDGNGANPNKVWRTIDGGKNWSVASLTQLPSQGYIDAGCFTFKDSLQGWFSGGVFNSPYGVYETIDGGKSWNSLLRGNIGPSIFYVPSTNLLLCAVYAIDKLPFLFSMDGINFASAPAYSGTRGGLGLTFSDDLHGILCSGDPSNGKRTELFYTEDGGLTWQAGDSCYEFYQPIGISKSQTFFAISELRLGINRMLRSDNGGRNWHQVYQYPNNIFPSVTGCMQAGLSMTLFFQSSLPSDGIMMSLDTAKTFIPICGPANDVDTRFYVRDSFIYAGDNQGGLWLNTTGIGSNSTPQLSNINFAFHSDGCHTIDTAIIITFFDSCNGVQADLKEISISGSNQFSLIGNDSIRKLHKDDSLDVRFDPTIIGSGSAKLHLRFHLGFKDFDTTISLIGTTSYKQPTPQISSATLNLKPFGCKSIDSVITLTFFDSCSGIQADLKGISLLSDGKFSIVSGENIRQLHKNDSIVVRYDPQVSGSDTAFLKLTFHLGFKDFDTTITLTGSGSSGAERVSFSMGMADSAFTGATIGVPVFVNKSISGRGLTSVSFDLKYNGDLLEYAGCSVKGAGGSASGDACATGSPIVSGKTTTLPVTITGTDISLDSLIPLIDFTFHTFLTDTNSTEIAMTNLKLNNGDPDYANCVLSADTTSTTYKNIYRCTEPILEQFLKTKTVLFITSIRPNPADNNIEVGLLSPSEEAAELDCVNALGNVCFSQKIILKQGNSSLPVLVKELPSGLYVLRIRTATQTVTQSFLKD